MGEQVLLGPAGKVELGPYRQEVEAGLRQMRAALAREHRIEPCPQGVEMEHVARGIALLRLAQLLRTPVRALLALVEIDAEQLAEAMMARPAKRE